MLKKRDYETFLNFLVLHDYEPFYWVELKQNSDNFAWRESKQYREQLKNELMQLRQNSWYDIKYFMLRETGRRFKKEKDFNHLIDTILSSLQDSRRRNTSC